MSKWTYSEYDGQHNINDERGVLIAMVCDAETAEYIVSAHEQLAEKEAKIQTLTEQRDTWEKCYDQASESIKVLIRESNQMQSDIKQLRKALDNIKNSTGIGYEAAWRYAVKIAEEALGE